MEDESKVNRLILRSTYITIIVLMIAVIALLILKYHVEGEQNMPFKLSSMIVVSNAEGYQEKENKDYRWDAEIYQNNDVYLNIEKNKNYNEPEAIKSIIIDNIQINQNPQVGKIEFYRPSKENAQTYNYQEEYKMGERTEYTGEVESDIKNLKIGNQGNTLMFRIVNKTAKRYTSNEEILEHNGKLLNKVGITYEQVKSKVSFDLTICLESDISFKANIELELPVGDITKDGSSNLEITDMKDIIFKREQT